MFTLPKLPYAYDALEPHIDARTMEIHHDKHHGTYVKNLNDALAGQQDLLKMDIVKLLQNLDQVPEKIRTKVRNNGGGHYNHSLFWESLTPKSSKKPSGEVARAITETFGSFTNFQEKFAAAATSRFGSGWAWLAVYDGGLCICTTANQDSPIMKEVACDCDTTCECGNACTPILGLDVWEHAYYLKYQNKRADYITAWWNVVNWDIVDQRFLDSMDEK